MQWSIYNDASGLLLQKEMKERKTRREGWMDGCYVSTLNNTSYSIKDHYLKKR